MDDTRDVPKKGQKDVDPEMQANTDLKKSPQRWKDDGTNDFNELHVRLLNHSLCRWFMPILSTIEFQQYFPRDL